MNIINDFKALEAVKYTSNFTFKAKVGRYLIKLTKEKSFHHDTPDYEYEIIDTKTGNFYQNSGRDNKANPDKHYEKLPSIFKGFKVQKNIIKFLENRRPNVKISDLTVKSLYKDLRDIEIKENKKLVSKTIDTIKEKSLS